VASLFEVNAVPLRIDLFCKALSAVDGDLYDVAPLSEVTFLLFPQFGLSNGADESEDCPNPVEPDLLMELFAGGLVELPNPLDPELLIVGLEGEIYGFGAGEEGIDLLELPNPLDPDLEGVDPPRL
jgi:hypothetical protein